MRRKPRFCICKDVEGFRSLYDETAAGTVGSVDGLFTSVVVGVSDKVTFCPYFCFCFFCAALDTLLIPVHCRVAGGQWHGSPVRSVLREWEAIQRLPLPFPRYCSWRREDSHPADAGTGACNFKRYWIKPLVREGKLLLRPRDNVARCSFVLRV